MFIFSWKGLGFLAPAVMGTPFFLVYSLFKLLDVSAIKSWFFGIAFAAVIAPIVTYYIGKALNKKQTHHMFCEIRFEHWAIILAAMELIVVLGIGSMFSQEHNWGKLFENILFWSFMISIVVVPIATAVFIRKYKRLDAKEI